MGDGCWRPLKIICTGRGAGGRWLGTVSLANSDVGCPCILKMCRAQHLFIARPIR